MLDLAKALLTIQQNTTVSITFPNDEDTPLHELTHIIWAAKILRGEPAPLTAASLTVELEPTAADTISQGGPQPLETFAQLSIHLDGNEIDLGHVHLSTTAAYVTVSPQTDTTRATATGPEGQALTLNARLARPGEIGRAGGHLAVNSARAEP